MWGANPEELTSLAARLGAQAGEIERVQASLTGRLRAAPWEGRAADRYRNRWEAVDRKQILLAAEFLRSAARDLQHNASQQTDASRAGGAPLIGTAATALFANAGLRLPSADQAWDAFSEVFPLLADLVDGLEVVGGPLGSVLSGSLGLFQAFMGVLDLAYIHPYEGNFAIAESFGDVLVIAGGGIAIVAAAAALVVTAPATVPIILGVGYVVGGTGALIGLGLEGWDQFGRDATRWVQREWTSKVAPEIDKAWDSAYEAASDRIEEAGAILRDGVDSVSVGARKSLDAVSDGISGLADGATGGWRKVKGWLR